MSSSVHKYLLSNHSIHSVTYSAIFEYYVACLCWANCLSSQYNGTSDLNQNLTQYLHTDRIFGNFKKLINFWNSDSVKIFYGFLLIEKESLKKKRKSLIL